MRKHITKRLLLSTVAVGMLFAGSAFTASNSGMDNHQAGVGSAEVSGVAVTEITYDLDSTKTDLNGVDFATTEADSTTSAEFSVDNGSTWENCESIADADTFIDCNLASPVPFSDVQHVSLVVTSDSATTS